MCHTAGCNMRVFFSRLSLNTIATHHTSHTYARMYIHAPARPRISTELQVQVHSPLRYKQSSDESVRFSVGHADPLHRPPTAGEPARAMPRHRTHQPSTHIPMYPPTHPKLDSKHRGSVTESPPNGAPSARSAVTETLLCFAITRAVQLGLNLVHDQGPRTAPALPRTRR